MKPPVAKQTASEAIFRERFAEISPAMNPGEALLEADRCLYCFDAPCVQACPTHIDVPKFIKQIASRNLTGSARTILEANPMGHSCARVCPVEALCEGACVYEDWHGKPIQIARLQRHATDAHYRTLGARAPGLGAGSGPRLFEPGPDNGRRVAVVGAGPAGLSCAFYLRRLGHPVVIFEAKDLPGGLNTYGIAEYKMTQSTALQEARMVLDLGAELRTGVEIGKDVALDALEREFEAVFIGIGLGETRSLRIAGENLPGVWDALGFIERVKRRDVAPLGQSRVTVVIGAGNTAIDAATQAKRLGAERVVMAYRRAQEEMGAYNYEFELAKLDEVEFLWNAAPKEILGGKKAEGIRFVRTRAPSATGGEPEPIPGSEFEVACDRVIKAIGQGKRYSIVKAAGLKLDSAGRIAVDPQTLQTSNPRYFAGGDAVNGGKEVVFAAADGKRAAWSIHRRLTQREKPLPGHAYWTGTIDGGGRG